MRKRKQTLVWTIDWPNNDQFYWDKKHDSLQEALALLSREFETHLFIVSEHRRDTVQLADTLYHYCSTIPRAITAIGKVEPDLINLWGFNCPINRAVHCQHPDLPKTVYYVRGSLSETQDFPHVSRVFVSTEADRQIILGSCVYPKRQVIVCPFTAPSDFCLKDPSAGPRYDVVYISDWRPGKRQHILLEALDSFKGALDWFCETVRSGRDDPPDR